MRHSRKEQALKTKRRFLEGAELTPTVRRVFTSAVATETGCLVSPRKRNNGTYWMVKADRDLWLHRDVCRAIHGPLSRGVVTHHIVYAAGTSVATNRSPLQQCHMPSITRTAATGASLPAWRRAIPVSSDDVAIAFGANNW